MRKIFNIKSLFKILTISLMVCLALCYLCPFVDPQDFKILPFFGLAYPVIILLSFIFLIVWGFIKSKYALFILIMILIGGKLHFRMLAIGSEKALPKNKEIWKILSYNVRLFDLYNWSENKDNDTRQKIFAYLKEADADVICFQEFYHQDKPSKFSTRDTLIDLLRIKDYHERYSYKLNGRQNFGINMLSKYPMIAKGDIAFDTENGNTDNYCIFADIVKGDDTLRIYNLHLQSIKFQKTDYTIFENKNRNKQENQSAIAALYEKLQVAYPKRARQAEMVIEHIGTSPYPVVVCGDFNDTPMSYVYNQFYSNLKDAFRTSCRGIGSTYVGKIPAGRIDYIFNSNNLSSSNFRIQNKALSDHKAISCLIWKND